MSNNIIPQASNYHSLLAANGLTQNVKYFEGLYTQIAISENGYIASYIPYIPAIKGGFLKEGRQEVPESINILHISQINDFDIDVQSNEKTTVSGGLGGAIVGGLFGGAVGSVIGSAATSGNVKTNTTITGVTLIIDTKDFNNPRVEIPLYSPFIVPNVQKGVVVISSLPYSLRLLLQKTSVGYCLDKEGHALAKDVFCMGTPNVAQIEALQSTLTQMLTAQNNTGSQVGTADELTKFKSLLDSGAITPEEYEQKKRQLLGL